MRILFTGGGTGGHFYPIIAVAEELDQLIKEKHLLEPELFYLAPEPYNPGLLYEHRIEFKPISAGKLRRYFSLNNFFDLFKTGWGILKSMVLMYQLYPDVVFGKGGYASFPVLVAAKLLRIPVVIHESDTSPGKVNAWAGKFAKSVAVSYPEAAKYFNAEVVHTGNPIRKDIALPIVEGAREFLKLEKDVPVVLILGGSQGAENINEIVLEALPELVEKYAIIHQTGKRNILQSKETSEAVLFKSGFKDRYKPYDYLDTLAMRMAAGVASVVISRAGSTIFEIAAWGTPSIIVPIPESVSHDQRDNAFAYARAGACVVIEEENLTAHILKSEIDRIVDNKEVYEKMRTSALAFYKPTAARKIAEEILQIALGHEIKQ